MSEQPVIERPKVCIATPMHDHRATAFYMHGIIHSYLCGRFELNWVKVGGAGIVRARNMAVWEFLQTKSEYLLFIDGDIKFKPDHISKIIGHLMAIDGPAIVGTLYPHKT